MSDIFDLDESSDMFDLDESYEDDDDLGNMMLEDINSNNMDLHYHQNLNVSDSIKPGKIAPYDGNHNPAITQKTEIPEEQYNYVISRLHKSMHEATNLMGLLTQVRPEPNVDYSEAYDPEDIDNLDLDTGYIGESADVLGDMKI